MENSENNNSNETKTNSMEDLEEGKSKFSDLNSNNNENKMKNNKFHNEIENLKTMKMENNNNMNNVFIIPQDLKKTFIITIILTITGIILIFCGIIKAVIIKRISGGVMFWILAILVLIPGGFYSFQFCRAKYAQRDYERQDILDSIPKL